nr:MAG TPA: hypothetical protein [Caudoviricetes sp.]
MYSPPSLMHTILSNISKNLSDELLAFFWVTYQYHNSLRFYRTAQTMSSASQ